MPLFETPRLLLLWSLRLLLLLPRPVLWLLQCARLVVFALLLTPVWVQLVPGYLAGRDVVRGVPYGPRPRRRNDLDIYLPPRRRGPREGAPTATAATASTSRPAPPPVVLFVTGGAWVIGYKLWGLALARRLCAKGGVLTLCMDYRNFPQSRVSGMVEDVGAAVSAVLGGIAEAHGGDPDRVYVVGQSAGAHLGACVMLERALERRRAPPPMTTVSSLAPSPPPPPRDIRRFVGVSGPFDLLPIAATLAEAGFGYSLLHTLFEADLERFSPTRYLPSLAAALRDEEGKGREREGGAGRRGMATAPSRLHLTQPAHATAAVSAASGAPPPPRPTSDLRRRMRVRTASDVAAIVAAAAAAAESPARSTSGAGAVGAVHHPATPDLDETAELSRILLVPSPTAGRGGLEGAAAADPRAPAAPPPLAHFLPPVTLIHGSADHIVPHTSSLAFAAALLAAGMRLDDDETGGPPPVPSPSPAPAPAPSPLPAPSHHPSVGVRVYAGASHTGPMLEDLFDRSGEAGGGGEGGDRLVDDILRVLLRDGEWDGGPTAAAMAQGLKGSEGGRAWMPRWLLSIARVVNPF
jgi:acetyl esterase/lipase